jgi:hypothetical protein
MPGVHAHCGTGRLAVVLAERVRANRIRGRD